MNKLFTIALGALTATTMVACATTATEPAAKMTGDKCGPQAPRDITVAVGTNSVMVPEGETPRLCNVHFHEPYEHAGFVEPTLPDMTPGEQVCKSVTDGDRVEFHWVYTNCPQPASPVKGLGNCVCDRPDMVLRVYAQGYVVGTGGEMAVTQPSMDFQEYKGSTTGPSYDDFKCSPARVNWHVAKKSKMLDKATLGKWCEANPWPGEDHPHGARKPVQRTDWLSPMKL